MKRIAHICIQAAPRASRARILAPRQSIIMLLLGLLAPFWADSALAAACAYKAGSPELLIRATVLAPGGPIERGSVLIDQEGRIACVGKRCAGKARVRPSELDCGQAVLSPGFINPHDHIDFANIAPGPDSGERFDDRHQWRKGLQGHTRLEQFEPTQDPRVIAWGELRFLVGGTVSIVGEAMAPGFTRNLDKAAGLEGLPMRPVTYRVFPLDDAAGLQRVGDCDYGAHPATRADVVAAGAFVAHVSEGTDASAHNEFRCESSASFDTAPLPGGGGTSHDWIAAQATLIHAVALTRDDLKLVARRHASIVWSPRSNLSLYGATLNVAEAMRLHINIALGSDWLPSGSMDMNRELACAEHYNQTHLEGRISNRQLWEMATMNAARATHSDSWIGSIQRGKFADLALFARSGRDPYASAAASSPQSTILVLRGGTVLYGDSAVIAQMRPDCTALPVPGAQKQLCAEPGAVTPSALLDFAKATHQYPLAFDGPPLNEPPCEPRARTKS